MDHQLLFLINREWTLPAIDMVMAAASSWDAWWPFLLAVGVVLAIFGGFHGRVFLLVAGLAIGLTDAVVVDTLKGVVNRPRPHEAVSGVRTLDLAPARPRILAVARPLRVEISGEGILPPVGNAFPSGHASNNFAVAAVLMVFYRRFGWLFLIPACLVSYSRIYVGSHWPSDVAVSALLGLAIGFLTCALAELLWTRIGARLLPRISALHPSLIY